MENLNPRQGGSVYLFVCQVDLAKSAFWISMKRT